jgi:hypothetical protein
LDDEWDHLARSDRIDEERLTLLVEVHDDVSQLLGVGELPLLREDYRQRVLYVAFFF